LFRNEFLLNAFLGHRVRNKSVQTKIN
jgi:hypothetical protein